MSKKVLIFMVIFSLCLIVGSLYIISALDPGKKVSSSVEVADIAAKNIKVTTNFTLHTATNQDFTLENLKNKFSVLYFGFTYCPDICPDTMQKLKAVANNLTAEELAQTQFLFVSIDPFRDKDKELLAFVDEYGGSHMIGINGSEEEIDKLAFDLKVYHAKGAGNEKNYRIDHTAFVYILNPKAELVAQYTQGAEVADMLSGLKAIINEK